MKKLFLMKFKNSQVFEHQPIGLVNQGQRVLWLKVEPHDIPLYLFKFGQTPQNFKSCLSLHEMFVEGHVDSLNIPVSSPIKAENTIILGSPSPKISTIAIFRIFGQGQHGIGPRQIVLVQLSSTQ